RIDEDETIIGVVGFDESRKNVRDAIDKLRSKAIPVISTAATFDELGLFENAYAPSLFPLSPPNSELANYASGWARAGVLGRGIPGEKKAAVFVDITAGDLYTADIGDKFQKEFGDKAELVRYSGSRGIDQEVKQLCTRGEQPDLFYYAGRASQFGAFIEGLS